MKHGFKTFLLGPLALALGLFVLPVGANALTISPAFVDNSLNPGDTVIETLDLYNEDQFAITLYPQTANFTAGEDEGGTPKFYDSADDPYGTALAQWITLDADVGSSITLKPGERRSLVYTINVPYDVQPGGHFGALVLGTLPSTDERGGIGIEQQIGELIFVRVSGDIKEQAGLAEFGFKKPQVWYNSLPVEFFVRFENSGNTHLRPTGNLFVKNWWGRQVAAVVVNGDFKSVLPHSIRRFEFAWGETGQADGGDSPDFMEGLVQEWKNFALGKHKATLVLTYGASNKIITEEREFTVWPWRLMVVGGVGLVMVLALLWLLVKLNNMAVIRRYERMKKLEKK